MAICKPFFLTEPEKGRETRREGETKAEEKKKKKQRQMSKTWIKNTNAERKELERER